MLGPKLARRIVPPLLFLIVALFALLALAASRIVEDRVSREMEETARRVARTLDSLPQARPELLEALAELVGAEVVVAGIATKPWPADEVAGLVAGEATLSGKRYRVLEEDLGRRGRRCFVLFAEERIEVRRRDALIPLAVAGTLGLIVALALGLLVARRISAPVKALADSVKGFGEGRFDGGVGERGPGEIGDLQDAFVKMVEAIREGEEKLRESERFAALGRLAGGIAHELRNPLTAIRMAVETVTGEDDACRADARRVALAEIDRLDRTLRELLDFVRPRQPKLESLRVLDVFHDVAELLGPQCRHLKVELEIDADEGVTVDADADRLKQALLNLVLNGAQAQPLGGVVRLRARPGLIEVEDAGSGIDEAVAESLLQPFVTTKEAGIGLGLAVVAQVADEHGWRLDFRSGPGGTTFLLRF